MKKNIKYKIKIFLITAVISTFFGHNVFSQTIVSAEYFFNTDPGVGHATAFSIIPGDTILSNHAFNTTGLNPGFNTLFIRVKNNLGQWSHYEGRTILIKNQPVATTPIVTGEYFFDTDPGVGHATAIPPFTPGNDINIPFVANTAGLQEGFHSLFFRVKDVAGKWSHYDGRIIYVKKNQTTYNLVYCEYFFNTDPGVGHGVPFSFAPDSLKSITDTIFTTGLPGGLNNLFFRFRDSRGYYSLYAGLKFRICDHAAFADFSTDTVCLGDSTSFINLSTHGDTSTVYLWDFDGNGSIDKTTTGLIGQSTPLQFDHLYNTGGTFQCKLITDNGGGCSDTVIKPVVVRAYMPPQTPTGPMALCKNSSDTTYSIHHITGAISYIWVLSPFSAGTMTNIGDTAVRINWDNNYTGNVTIKVKANYGPCSGLLAAPYSAPLNIFISNPSVGGTISLAQSAICEGSVTGNISLSGNIGSIVRWQKRHTALGGNPGPWVIVPFSNNTYSETPSSSGIWDYRAVIKNGACDTAWSNYGTITVYPLPTPAGNITGTAQVCTGQQMVSYTVPAIYGATSYTWNVPNGALVFSGSTTNSVLVNYSPTANSGSITVLGSNMCGNGVPSQPFPVTVHISPIARADTDIAIIFGHTTPLYGSESGGVAPYTYSWSPPTLLINPLINNPVTKPLQNSTTFILTVTDSLGCKGTDPVYVTVYGQPFSTTPTADPPIICQGANCQLNVIPSGGSGTYTYAWSTNPPTVFTSFLKNPVVNPTVTTQYVVVVSDGAQTLSNSVTVSISPKPVTAGTITGSATVCKGETGVTYTVPLIANANGYTWTLPQGASIYSGSNTNSIVVNFASNAQSPGTISVYGTNNCGSGSPSPNFSYIANQVPIADAGPTQYIQIGATTTLHGTVPGGTSTYSYSWEPSALLVSPNAQNTLTNPLNNSNSFTLTVTDLVTGCTGTATVLVLVQGFPLSATSSAVPASICQGGSSQISALPTGGSGNYTFAWSSNPGIFSSTLQSPTVSPTITTEYTVTVTSGGLTTSSNVVVTVSPIPTQVGLVTGDNVICKGDTNVAYSVATIPNALNYYWTLPPGAYLYSGNGTNTILVNYPLGASSGSIHVYASNFCGNGPTSIGYPIVAQDLPVANAGADIVLPVGGYTTLNGSASGGSGNYSYSWSPALFLDTATITHPTTIHLNNSTTFTLSVTDNVTGCSKTSQMQVILSGGPLQASASAMPQLICQGSTSQLNALPQGGTGNYTYAWSSVPSGLSSTVKNPTVSPTVATTYTVIVDDGNGMTSATTMVSINPLPDAAGVITGDNQVCQGEPGINFTVPLIPNATGYNWILPSGVTMTSGSNTNLITVHYTPFTNSDTIKVAGTNFCGSGAVSPPYAVHVDSLPHVDAGSDVQIPQNGIVQLNGTAWGGSGNFGYSWSPTANLNNPLIHNPLTSQMAGSAVFTLTVTDNVTQCKNSDQVQVVVTGVPLSVYATATPTTICQAGQSSLYALPTGGTGTYTYSWTSNPSGFTSTLPNPPATPAVTTTYTVVIDDGGSTESSSCTVTVSTLPGTAGTIAGPTAVCKGESGVNFTVPPINGATSYVWSLPNGATIASGANTNSISVDFSAMTTTGLVSVYGVNACGNGAASSYTLTLNPLPIANAGADLYIAPGFDTLQGTANGGFGTYSYLWSPSILLVSANIYDPITVPLSNPATFHLIVTDSISGCKGTDDMTVYILGGPLSVVATASSTNICQGQTSTLNVMPTGGLGSYTYSWTSNPGNFTSTLQNPIVSPTVTTTYYVATTSGNSTVTTSVTVTVNPLPSTPGAISGTNILCQGTNSVNYTVLPVNGATSYNWTLPSGASIVGGQGTNAITVNFSASAASGNITVAGVNLCGTGTASAGFHVTLNTSPFVNAGASQTVTSGATVTLTGSVTGGIGPFSYLWNPLMFFSPLSDADSLITTTVNLQSSVTFTLTVLDISSGCSASNQVNIYVGGGPLTATATASQTNICQGQASQLNALPSGGTGSYQYLWSSFPPVFTSTLQNPSVSPSVTTQYLVVVISGTDTTAATVLVNVSPQPTAAGTITGTSPVCQGATGVMYTVPAIANTTGYMWNLPSGFTIVSGAYTNTIYVDVANTASTGSISVYGYNNCGVGLPSPYFNAAVNPSPTAFTSADHLVPLNTIDTLHGYATGGSSSYTYSWDPASMLVANNVQNPITNPLTHSAIFTLVVTDYVTGCQSSGHLQIIVFGGPLTVAVSSDLYNICDGESVQLNALPTGGNGQYNYIWTPNPTLNNSTIYNPVATPNITTEYTVNLTSGGLTASNSLLITVSPHAGNAGTITGVNTVCQDETGVLFTVPVITNATTYHWTVPYGATIVSGSNTNSIMVNFSNYATSGNISVYGGNVCGFGNVSPNFLINVNPIPTVSAGIDQQIQSGLNTNLYGLVSGGSGGYHYQWTPSIQLINATILSPITQILYTSQIFTLYVTDTVNGCTNSDYMKVIVCDNSGNIPLSVVAMVNNDTICEGQDVLLDALPTGGNCAAGDYSWSSVPGNFSSTLVNPVATPTVSTTYIVSYNDGLSTATNSVAVTVNPLVADAGQIQGANIVCQSSGTHTYAIPPITGATSYIWTFPHGTVFMSNPDSNIVVVLFSDSATNGYISVYGTSSCGTGVSSPTFIITVKPIPAAAGHITGPSYIAKNNTAQFSVPPIAGTSTYYWVLPYGAVILSGQGTNTITVEFTDVSKSGFIFVYGINSCGTGDPSSSHLLTIVTSTSELNEKIDLKLYPNPNNGEFTLEINAATEGKYDMKILNVFGSEVISSQITGRQNRLDFSQLSNGLYYVVLTNDNVKIVQRFVIMK